jgi:hypothetical protein
VFIAWINTVFGKLAEGVVRQTGSGTLHHPLKPLFHDRVLAALLKAALLNHATAVSTSSRAVPKPCVYTQQRDTQPPLPAARTSFAPRLADVQNFKFSIKGNKFQIYIYKLSHFRLPGCSSHQSAPRIVKIDLTYFDFNFIHFTAMATETFKVNLILDMTDFHEK